MLYKNKHVIIQNSNQGLVCANINIHEFNDFIGEFPYVKSKNVTKVHGELDINKPNECEFCKQSKKK